MNAYLKLVNFEVNRFAKLYIWLAALIFVIQIVTTIIMAKTFMSSVANLMQNGSGQLDNSDMIEHLSLFDITLSFGFFIPIVIGIVSLLFYMCFIWYRDWFSKSTFIYRLLTLPTARMNVFFAKITTVMLSVLGLVSLQLIVLRICEAIIGWIVPVTFRDDMSMFDTIHSSFYLDILFPSGFLDFLTYYGIGLTFVIVVFTFILLERSFRLIGILWGVLYGVVCIGLLLAPVILQWISGEYLYEAEFFFVQLFVFIVITAGSLVLSRFLINKKVTV